MLVKKVKARPLRHHCADCHTRTAVTNIADDTEQARVSLTARTAAVAGAVPEMVIQ